MTPEEIKQAARLVEEKEKLEKAIKVVNHVVWNHRIDEPILTLNWGSDDLGISFDRTVALEFLNSRLAIVKTNLANGYGVKV